MKKRYFALLAIIGSTLSASAQETVPASFTTALTDLQTGIVGYIDALIPYVIAIATAGLAITALIIGYRLLRSMFIRSSK